MPYDPMFVQPMREELTGVGVRELLTAKDVDDFMAIKSGTALLIVNSVCGCAAGGARPAIAIALQHQHRPDRTASVFAGQDLEATDRARSYFPDYPPTSPSLALFKDGEVIHFVPRHGIEGRDPREIAYGLVTAFDEHCAGEKAEK
ncbi:MAG: BrxA/BrxB family bacilliredoxin [Planctomycetota bacterium]